MIDRCKRFEKGDLVRWDVGHYDEMEIKVGIIMQIWDSNVYEPEECEVFADGETFYVPSKRLRLQRGHRE